MRGDSPLGSCYPDAIRVREFVKSIQKVAAVSRFRSEERSAPRIEAIYGENGGAWLSLVCHTVGTVPPPITNSVPVMDAAGETLERRRDPQLRAGLVGRPIGIPPSECISAFGGAVVVGALFGCQFVDQADSTIRLYPAGRHAHDSNALRAHFL